MKKFISWFVSWFPVIGLAVLLPVVAHGAYIGWVEGNMIIFVMCSLTVLLNLWTLRRPASYLTTRFCFWWLHRKMAKEFANGLPPIKVSIKTCKQENEGNEDEKSN